MFEILEENGILDHAVEMAARGLARDDVLEGKV